MGTPVAPQFLAGSAPVALTSGGAPTTICFTRAAALANRACCDADIAVPKKRRSILYADCAGTGGGPEESEHAHATRTAAKTSNRPRRRMDGTSLKSGKKRCKSGTFYAF